MLVLGVGRVSGRTYCAVDGQPVRLRPGGRGVMARSERVADLDGVDRLLDFMAAATPSSVGSSGSRQTRRGTSNAER
ncbi:MAG: hypothetical protein ACRDY3_05415 [Acidimicrobiales bacterium]